MAEKRIDKKFLLSDDSVNCYGFRMLTSGYQLSEYQRNPIGYYMHNREQGVVVKWVDLAVTDGVLYGYPVINMAHPRGKQTCDEILSGFLNAASVGHLVVLEYSNDTEMMLPGQTGPTITKWYNKECSLVDIPGNNNAYVLFDKEGNSIKLADLMAGEVASGGTGKGTGKGTGTGTGKGAGKGAGTGEVASAKGLAMTPTPLQEGDNNENFNRKDMKQVTLSLSAAFYAGLGLAAAATPAEIEAKLPGLLEKVANAEQLEVDKVALAAERDSLQKKLDALTKTTLKAVVDGYLEAALEDKKITVEVQTQLAKDYATNPEGLKALLAGMSQYSSVTSQIKLKSGEAAKKYEGKTWDDLYKADMLGKMKAECPDLYADLYEREHGVRP